MRYSIRKTNTAAARIAVESSPALDPSKKPEIWRFFPGETSLAEMSKGAVLGREASQTCAYVIHVRPDDLICVREMLVGIEDYCWRYFRIGQGYKPLALDLPNRCLSKRECSTLLKVTAPNEPDQTDCDDLSLRAFFAQRHPDWLQEIADRQIAHWNKNKPDKYFRFVPTEVAEREIPRCVKVSPYAALERFQHRLDRAQLSSCLINCPRAAVMFATDKIPLSKREDYLIDYAKEALLFAADKLSDQELGLCASIEMFAAFHYRTWQAPDRRAILLANSFLVSFFATHGAPISDIQEEIRKSILEFPRQWSSSDPEGFPSILKKLEKHVEMEIDPMLISELLETADPEDRKGLADYIVSSL